MRLHTSGASPFGRKVKVAAIELGLFDRIEILNQQLTPLAPSAAVVADNPLGKIPCLVTDSGTPLFDSRVIAEYLDSLVAEPALFPTGARRWPALVLQALGDGIMDAGVLTRYEQAVRGEGERSAAWAEGQLGKIERALDHLEQACERFEAEIDIGQISVGCALGYLDFRYADRAWRSGRPRLAAWFERLRARPSFERTEPH